MKWLRRIWPARPEEDDEAEEPEEADPQEERSAPGIAALFEGVAEDGSHGILDLGPAAATQFRIYSRYARRIRFADLLGTPLRGESWPGAFRTLPGDEEGLFDLVLAWDVLDRMPPKHRPTLLEHLVRLTSPGARLYVLVNSTDQALIPRLRFSLRGLDRVAHQPAGEPMAARAPLMPAEVERLVRPFRVKHAFTLRLGYREYVGVR